MPQVRIAYSVEQARMFKRSDLLLCTAAVLSLVHMSASSPPLYTCANIPYSGCRFGDRSVRCPSVCSYFFDAIESALVGDRSSLYTLQRAFFPDGEQKPNVVDIYTTLVLDPVIDITCDSDLNVFRDASISEINDVVASLGGMDSTSSSLCGHTRSQLCNSTSELDIFNETVPLGQNPGISESICSDNFEVNCSQKVYRWHHVWTSAVLTNVIERESLGLISSINSVAYITRLYSETRTNVIITTEQDKDFQPREIAFLELNVPNLLCLPNDPEATFQSALEEILPWIHTYAVQRGRISFSDGERAFIFEDSNVDPDSDRIFGTFQRREVDETIFVTYLTALHVLLQVAAGLTIMKLIPAYYISISKGRDGKRVEMNSSNVSIFWSNVFFATVLDVLFVGLDLYLIVSVYEGVDDAISAIITTSNRSALQTVFAFGMLGTLVTLFMMILQFFVAAGIPKNAQLYIPGVLKLFCCFFHCRCPCKKANGDFWRKVLQTFAIWFIMVFLQLVAGSVIPYLVLAIVNPVPAVTFLALGASTLFCLIIFVASIIQVGVRLKKSNCYEKVVALVQGLVFIVFLGLVAITVIIYQGVIQSGTDTGVVSGIALSLIPSAIIAVLGFAVKSKLLSDGDEENPNAEHESLLTRATSLLRKKASKIVHSEDGEKECSKNDSHTTVAKNGVEEEKSNGDDCSFDNEKNTLKRQVVDCNVEAAKKTNPDFDLDESSKCKDMEKVTSKTHLLWNEGTDSGTGMGEDDFSTPSIPDEGAEADGDSDRNESADNNPSQSDKVNDKSEVCMNDEVEGVVLTIDFPDVDSETSA